MDQQVDVVVLAVELLQLGFEVRACLGHDLLASRQHRVCHRLAPVGGDDNQGDVAVVDDVLSRAGVGFGFPLGDTPL
jgi:hypothetical protein